MELILWGYLPVKESQSYVRKGARVLFASCEIRALHVAEVRRRITPWNAITFVVCPHSYPIVATRNFSLEVKNV